MCNIIAWIGLVLLTSFVFTKSLEANLPPKFDRISTVNTDVTEDYL